MSFDRLSVLVRHLPAESETARSLGVPGPGDWTQADFLLAGVVDLLGVGNYLFARANVKPGTHVPKPQPVPRPGDVTDKPKRPATPAELASALGGRGLVRFHPKGHG